jgi:Delta7-sterol 5-desaturase
VGEWATQGNAAHVRIERCPTAPELLCGLVTWLWEPTDAEGEPIRDRHNPDPRLRAQTVIGLSLLEDFRGDAMEGRIYNPENGRTYRASLKLRSPDILEVKGCVLIVCDTQVWRRVESLCGTLPKQTHGVGTAANRGMQ